MAGAAILRPVPWGSVVCLQAHTGNNLQNDAPSRQARCVNTNTLEWEHLRLLLTCDGKVVIHSLKNGRNLQVRPDGRCFFSNCNELLWEKFDLEMVEDAGTGRWWFYFRSLHTQCLLQADRDGWVRCEAKERGDWEGWRVIDLSGSPRIALTHTTSSGGHIGGDEQELNPNNNEHPPTAGAGESVNSDDIPEEFLCPLTLDVMREPVISTAGISYEKEAIERCLRHAAVDPVARLPCTAADLRPNRNLRDAIARWRR
eukprot:EG_transcript_22074